MLDLAEYVSMACPAIFEINSDNVVEQYTGMPKERRRKTYGNSYAILRVTADFEKEHLATFNSDVNQKMLKLAAELDTTSDTFEASVKILSDTLNIYEKFQKLSRLHNLHGRGSGMSGEEWELYGELFTQLQEDEQAKPFLPPSRLEPPTTTRG